MTPWDFAWGCFAKRRNKCEDLVDETLLRVVDALADSFETYAEE